MHNIQSDKEGPDSLSGTERGAERPAESAGSDPAALGIGGTGQGASRAGQPFARRRRYGDALKERGDLCRHSGAQGV